jgi:uncharacterized protein (TIGR02246 family)
MTVTLTLTELSDRAELRSLVEAYARGADRREPAAISALFTEDGTLVIFREVDPSTPAMVRTGRDEIADAMNSLNRWEVTTHFVGQQSLHIDGDSASGETYCLAHHLFHHEGERYNRVMSIRYLDRYTRTDGGWLISERHLMEDWVEYRAVNESMRSVTDAPRPPK